MDWMAKMRTLENKHKNKYKIYRLVHAKYGKKKKDL
jgi:hypothetical protein